MTLCSIWYHLYNLKNGKNTHGRVLLLVTMLLLVTKSNTRPWVFFMFFKLCKWYQIAQNITYARAISSINTFILCSNVQHVFTKYVTTVQSNWIIFFQESLEICAFFKCVGVHIYKNHQST